MTEHVQGRAEWVTTRDGRRLYAMVLPGPDTTGPTVVFEAGAAASRSSWALVQPLVGVFARAVVYDRSGLGRSPVDPGPRTLPRMAADLGDLLTHFGPGPYVLAGHSAGGPIVRAAAAADPGRITGLVLVDPTDEAADVLFGPAFRRVERVSIRVNLLLARLGLLGRLFRGMRAAVPADARRDLEREAFTGTAIRTQAAQARTYLDDLYAFRADPPGLGDLPVTVISGGRPGDGMTATLRAAANASHAHRAAQAPNGRHVIAERSGHYGPITEPEVIAEEIRRMCAGTRSASSPDPAGSDGAAPPPS